MHVIELIILHMFQKKVIIEVNQNHGSIIHLSINILITTKIKIFRQYIMIDFISINKIRSFERDQYFF